MLNLAISRIWSRVTADDVGYGQSSTTIPATPATETLSVPADHAITRGVYRPTSGVSGAYLPADRTTETAYRDRHPDDPSDAVALPGVYWYTPTALVLRPVPLVAEQVLITYITAPPTLSIDTDTFDAVIDWDDALIEFACAEAHQDERRRLRHEERAEKLLARSIAAWGSRRDRSPDVIGNYLRRPRSTHGLR